jgi:histidinol-phosphate aminotransferase
MKYRATLDQIRSFDPPAALNTSSSGNQRPLNLALNENSFGCSPHVIAAVTQAVPDLFRYPPTFCGPLRQRLAQIHSIEADQLLFGNGIFEILSLISQVFIAEGDEVVIPSPSFGWYGISAKALGAKVIEVPLHDHAINLDAVASAITPQTTLVWLCNPHNPMGSIVRSSALDRFLERVPDSVAVVLDEAYAEFADDPDFPDSQQLLARFSNLIVLKTFSKAYGLAGLRIGYAISSKTTISQLHKVKTPPNVNHLAQVAALAALADETFLQHSIQGIRQGASDYYAFCREQGINYIPTHANFIMIDIEIDGDEAAAEFLKNGIIIRSGREIGMPTWMRITIGNEIENHKVFGILRSIVERSRTNLKVSNIK